MALRIALALFTAVLTSAAHAERLSFVNSGPQFNVTPSFFALYLGVWRGFDAAEIEAIRSGASLLSERQISWQVTSCSGVGAKHEDEETIWTYDRLLLDSQGHVTPIAEATRPGYRYFSVLNLHGLFLRGTGDFRRSRRTPGETSTEYRSRLDREKAAWRIAASPKGTRGRVDVRLDMRLVDGAFEDEAATQFLNFADYAALGTANPQLKALFYKTAPNRWPVSYDERAHKPHNFSMPELWRVQAEVPLRQDKLRARFEWDWCDVDAPVQARIVFSPGSLLPSGPNRYGRGESGPTSISVVEESLED